MQIEAVAAAAAAAREGDVREGDVREGDVREGDVRVALDSQTADAEDEVPLSAVASPGARPRGRRGRGVGGGDERAAATTRSRHGGHESVPGPADGGGRGGGRGGEIASRGTD